MTERETLKKWLDESSNIVFFGGAGVSTESHIPDFRSTDGLYNQEYDYPPETILSHSFYMRKPEEFYRFYRNKMLFPNAEPKPGAQSVGKAREDGKAEGSRNAEYRRTPSEGGKQRSSGTSRFCPQKSLHPLRKILRSNCVLNSTGVPKCTCGGTIQAGCCAL